MWDSPQYWEAGAADFLHANPNDGQYEVFRGQYDPVRRVVVVKHDMYEDAEVVVAAARLYSLPSADLSAAIPIKGLWIGEPQAQVEHVLGRGYRNDHCGKPQYYYSSVTDVLVLTYESGKLTRFFGGFYTD